MTKEEKKAMAHIVKFWNAFRLLEVLHPDDTKDVKFHVHAIQNILMSRPEMAKQSGWARV